MKINYLEHHGVKGMKWGVRRKRVANNGLSDFKMSTKKVMLGNTPSTQYTWHSKTGDKVGEFKTWDWWDGKNISDFEINPKYRGQGLSYKFLDYATQKLGVKNLSVRRHNAIAKHVYDKYGFETTDEDDNYYYMSLKEKKHD